MEVNFIGTVIADVNSEFTDQKTNETKKSRHLYILTGTGKTFKVQKIKVPLEYRNEFEVQTFSQIEIPNVEMSEWSMNGRSGISYSLKNLE